MDILTTLEPWARWITFAPIVACSVIGLAGGIGTALQTTIAGIAVGILALVFHRVFTSRIDRRIGEIEELGLSAVDLVTEDDR